MRRSLLFFFLTVFIGSVCVVMGEEKPLSDELKIIREGDQKQEKVI